MNGLSIGGARRKKKKQKIKTKHTSMFRKKHCSPSTCNEISCLDEKLINQVAQALNKMSHKNKKLDPIDMNQSIENIYKDICLNISSISKCSSESCWMTIQSLMKELGPHKEKFEESFRPKMPKSWIKNYNKWLTTCEIEDVLKQYMDSDENFYFYGAVPMDFKKCSVSNLCSIDISDHLSKKQSKIGIVFNTDPSTKEGEHWISMYIDLGNHNHNCPGIYYFDSYGKKPSKEITQLIQKVKSQCNQCKKKILYFYNDIPYQKKDAQCGMFAIDFIKNMIEGKSFRSYLNEPLSDNLMSQLRNEYFIKL